jgi:diguanylate cyclase (GGDEF)-like protein
MTENVAILLAVLVAANVLLLSVLLVRAWTQRRRSRRRDALHAITSNPIERSSAGPRPTMTTGASTAGSPVSTGALAFSDGPAPTRTDRLTETLLRAEWNRMLADEDARIHRYRRPATIVLIELEGFEGFVSALGQPAGDRVLVAVADTLKRHARSSDQVARLGPARFGLLLPETGEVEAINLTERMRSLCELWLASGSIALRLAIGWASPAVEEGLADSYLVAAERMYAEVRRNELQVDDVETAAADLQGAASPA